MKIVKVSAHMMGIVLPRPGGEAPRRNWIFVRIETDEGITGVGEATTENYEYAVVNKTQPSAAEATALKAFLNWIVTTGNTSTYLTAVEFEPLPSARRIQCVVGLGGVEASGESASSSLPGYAPAAKA